MPIGTAPCQLLVIAYFLLVSTGKHSAGSPLTPDCMPPSHRLLDDLFQHYRKEIRPVTNDSTPVEVTVHLWFKQVLKVDEIDQILTVYAWVEEYWQDDFLTWDPAKYGGVEILHVPADRIWRPDLMIYNNADMNIRENELTTNAVLNYTGSVMCFRAMITKITCNLDMTYFPFDRQNCSMMLASWSSDGSKVTVLPKKANNNLVYYIENTEWKLLDFMYNQQTKYYDCCPEPYPDITYYFVLERNPSYYVLNLIIPSVFITVVTMVGFFTPYSSTGENTEKVSLGVTALLSLAIILLMVADKMPATSKVIPLIGKYYIGLIWLIFAATIITTVTLRLQSKGNGGKPLSEDTKRVFFTYVARFLFMKLDLPTDASTCFQQQRNGQRANGQRKEFTFEPSPLVETFSEINGGIGETAFLLAPRNFTGCYYGGGPGGSRSTDCFSNSHYRSQSRRHSMVDRNNTDDGLIYCNNTQLQSSIIRPSTPCPNSDHHSNQPRISNRKDSSYIELETLYQLKKLRLTINEIEKRLAVTEDMQNIRKEWEQLARVCERLLMFAFVFFTILFATLMLHFHGQGEVPANLHQHTQFQQMQPPQHS